MARLVSIALAAVLVLAGCGGSEPAGTPQTYSGSLADWLDAYRAEILDVIDGTTTTIAPYLDTQDWSAGHAACADLVATATDAVAEVPLPPDDGTADAWSDLLEEARSATSWCFDGEPEVEDLKPMFTGTGDLAAAGSAFLNEVKAAGLTFK